VIEAENEAWRRANPTQPGWENKADKAAYVKAIQGTTQSLQLETDLIEILARDPRAIGTPPTTHEGQGAFMTGGNRSTLIIKELKNIDLSIGGMAEYLGYDETDPAVVSLRKAVRIGMDPDGAHKAAIDAGMTEAMLIDVAYIYAKQKDGGGRLSDKDVEMALKMLGGNSAAIEVFLGRAEQRMKMAIMRQDDRLGFYKAIDPKFASAGWGKGVTHLLRQRDALKPRFDAAIKTAYETAAEREANVRNAETALDPRPASDQDIMYYDLGT